MLWRSVVFAAPGTFITIQFYDMQTRKDTTQFPHLAEAAAIWQLHFPDPVEAMKSLNDLTHECAVVAVEKAKKEPGNRNLTNPLLRLNNLMVHIVIPSIQKGTENDLYLGLASAFQVDGLSYEEVTLIFHYLGLTMDTDGLFNRPPMVGFIRSLYGLSELSNYCEQRTDLMHKEVIEYLHITEQSA